MLKRSAGVGTNPLPYIIALVALVLDQVSKYLIVETLGPGQPHSSISLLSDFIELRYITNSGAAFGIFPGGSLFFALIALIVVIVIIAYYSYRPTDQMWLKLSLGLQLGGALGNLTDRIRFGYVIDFVDTKYWPVFNLADVSMTIGVFALAVFLLFLSEGEHRKATDAPTGGQE